MGIRSFSSPGARAVALAALVLGATAARRAQEQPVDQLKWIIGCWSMETARGEIISERWTRASRDTLTGISRTVKDDAQVGSETMHIFSRADALIFAALPSGQTYTEFTATHVGADSVVFENAAHDFPQRISYRITGDSLHALVSGAMNGSAMSIPFPMNRMVCEG